MSRTQSILILLVVIAVAAGGLWVMGDRDGSADAVPRALASAVTPSGVAPAPSADRHRNAAPQPRSHHQAQGQPGGVNGDRASQFLCSFDPKPCKQDPFLAASEAEAGWLASFGYPTPDEERELSALPRAELQKRADAGDLVAEVFLGKALMREGQDIPAKGRASDALAKGSIYAAYALSDFHGANSPRPNRIDEGAYLRLAYLQGDWKAAQRLAVLTSDPVERMMIDQRAMTLYRNLLDEKGRAGYHFTVGARPGSP